MKVVAPAQPIRHPELVSGSIARFARSQRGQAQPRRQILPVGIFALEQVDFPLPVPALELLFAGDRGGHVAKQFEAHQPVNAMPRGKAGQGGAAMLGQALDQVGGDADIQRAVAIAGKDIDARDAFWPHAPELADKWTLKQVQGDEILMSHPTVRHAELVSASIVQPERRGQ